MRVTFKWGNFSFIRVYTTRPASTESIKANRIDDKYDTSFVRSEVAAVVSHYVNYDTGKGEHPYRSGYYLNTQDDTAVGHKISTKAAGSYDRDDITSSYKEGPAMRSSENTTLVIF